ncbi:poly(A)-binding protein binding protein [Pleosporales sp. CAS-2024a]
MSTAAAANSSSNALNPPASTPGRPLKMSTTAKGLDAQRKPGSPVDGGPRKPPAQKAWTQGTNPITQRLSNPPAPNGVANPAPKPPQNPTTPSPMRHLSDRMMYLLANLTGLPGIITLKNGDKYSGVLSGTSLDPTELRYVFKMVKKLLPPANAQTNGVADPSDDYVGVGDFYVMSFDMSDVADFNVNNVVLDKSQPKPSNGTAAFRTDTDISGNTAIRERNLQKWEPTEIDPNMTLESTGRSNDWDQFATNERMFGVKSNYDETFYTTTIDRNDPQYAQRAARAEKIAREIEASSAMNSHVREERGGQTAMDEGGDDEDKYSGVRRDFPQLSTGQPNKYTPPARRAPAPQATVPGAPVDPAIISSSVARPDSASKTSQRTASPVTQKAPIPDTTKGDISKLTMPTASTEAPKSAAQKDDAKTTTVPGTTADPPPKPSATIKPTVGAIPPRKTGRPHDATTTVEHDLLDSFKQFSAAEKLRMSERQRVIARENKAVKLNDLKKFALNFKLSTPVPSDLVPILAKDETKQAAIVEKALKQSQETKSTPPKTTSTLADPKVATKTATAKPDSTHASPSSNTDRQQNPRSRPGQPSYASGSMRERQQQQQQNFNQIPPRGQVMLSTRLQLSHQQHKQQGGVPYNNVPQPIPPQDLRMPPTGPSQTSSGVQTPNSNASVRFNVRASEFKPNPSANTFQPGGDPSANSSPRPASAARQEPRKPLAVTSFFGGQRPPAKQSATKESFNAIARIQREMQEKDKDKPHHSDLPAPYRTPPTWDFPSANTEKSHVHMFEHTPAPAPLSAPHNTMGNGPIPHQHQLPPHLQGGQVIPQGQTAQHTPRGPPVQPHHGQGPHHFEAQHMQFSHSTSSVHPSPRPMHPYMYGAQPQPMTGYPQQVQMPQYGMSPNVQHVGLRNGQPGSFIAPPGPPMGGHMMTNQPSNGPYMGMPGNPQMQMYSPAPAQAYPQYPVHLPGAPGANGGFPNSPRPGAPMMSHSNSQQGHQQPPIMYVQAGSQAPQLFQMPPGSMTPMRGPYAQPHQPHYGSPHQHHQFPHQHRGTPSGSYVQPMMPQHPMPPQAPPTGPANHGPEANDEPK